MLATVAAANIKKVQIKKYSNFIYSEAEPHTIYALYKQMRKLCVLQYLIRIQLPCWACWLKFLLAPNLFEFLCSLVLRKNVHPFCFVPSPYSCSIHYHFLSLCLCANFSSVQFIIDSIKQYSVKKHDIISLHLRELQSLGLLEISLKFFYFKIWSPSII